MANLNRGRLEELGAVFELEIMDYLAEKFPNSIIMHNLEVFCKPLEKDTQIDIIMLTDKNVYLIEAKNWTGYIEGEYNNEHWTGISRARVKMEVFNPINQNDLHIRALRNALRNEGLNPPYFNNFVVVPDGTAIKSTCREVVNKSFLINRITRAEKTLSNNYDKQSLAEKIRKVCTK
jgi:hypothetical protein